jgi:hypothetical protein
MKAISRRGLGSTAADRAERGLGPLATLACPIYTRVPQPAQGCEGARDRCSTIVSVAGFR